MEDYTEILQEALDTFELRLKLQLLQDGRKASGKTIDSIYNTVTPTSGKLLGSGVLYYLIYGRGPSGLTAKAEEPSLFDLIKEWVKTKGIEAAAAWPITQAIHKKGTRLFQGIDSRFNGTKANTLDEVINELTLGDLRAKLGTAARKNVTSELLNLN